MMIDTSAAADKVLDNDEPISNPLTFVYSFVIH
jgi:hypothetical protein